MSFQPIAALRRLIGRQPPGDRRSGRLVAVIHCVLDQNVRDAGAASFPAANWAVLDLCREHGVGLLQMPCPEVHCLGMARNRPSDCSLRDALDTPAGRAGCQRLAGEMAGLIVAHLAAGRRVLAVLGGNEQSPGCAVHLDDLGLTQDSGVFLKELQDELRRHHINVPFLPMRDANADSMEGDLRMLEALFIAAA